MKWIYRFFVFLGVIFFFILVGLGYFIIADPLNLRPVMMSLYNYSGEMDTSGETTDNSVQSSNPEPGVNTGVLNDQQEAALKSVGISPDAVPTQFTPEQIECFVRILGAERVDDIKAGDTPTPAEYFKAKECV